MTDAELLQLRRQKWRLDGRAVRTLEDAREFIDSVGFCLLHPLRQPMLVPTFLGAYAGNDDHLPTSQHAFADPRAHEATELMVHLLRERAAYEAPFAETDFLLSAAVFPFFYGLVGDRNPRHVPKPGAHSEYSPLARDLFEIIRHEGRVSKEKLRASLGGDVSAAALDRALGELWSRLRIIRVDYNPQQGAFWDALFRWSPEAVREGIQVSVPEALSALISKYLECVIAAETQEIADFFSHFVPRSKVHEAVNALLGARELSFVSVGSRSKIQVTPPKAAPAPRRERRKIHPRDTEAQRG
jgi:hypothetical protein